MTSSTKSLKPQVGKSIVLSIKPKYAELILSGSKTVEFRRVWAAEKVDVIVIYASAPIQKFVGVVQVSELVREKTMTLWGYCSRHGGGLSKTELFSYFKGKDTGFAILLQGAKRFSLGIDPQKIIKDFSPPQSFRYISAAEVRKLQKITLQAEVVE
jgi:predicted transcriptional regulator